MATINQCIDMIESVRRGQSDACALIDSLRAKPALNVVNLTNMWRSRQIASALLRFLVVNTEADDDPKGESAKQ